MDEHSCKDCGAKFGSRHDLAEHNLKEHSHQPSDGVKLEKCEVPPCA